MFSPRHISKQEDEILNDFRLPVRESKVFWGQSKNEIKFGGTLFQLVKLGANFGGLK